MRKYASGTKVSVGKSRGHIDGLLRDFGAQGVQWTNEWTPKQRVTVKFIWDYKGVNLVARIRVTCNKKELEKDAVDGRSGKPSKGKLDKLLENWESEAHRLLLLFLKGAFFAIDGGIISAEQIFLPFFEDQSGNTVWEIMHPNLTSLPMANAAKLLGTGKGLEND